MESPAALNLVAWHVLRSLGGQTNSSMKKLNIILLLGGLLTPAINFAGEPEPVILDDANPAFVTPTLDLRARYEYGDVDVPGVISSHNLSLRGRVGLKTQEFNGFQVFGEYEGTTVADRDWYRAASVHGPANRTIIADPESHEVNQLWASYKTPDGAFMLKAGRQAIALDGQRYVGGVAWRQNMQTFDAATLILKPSSDVEFFYSYVNQVNRIFGSDVFAPIHTDFEGNSHLINAKIKNTPAGTLTAYAYLLDLTNDFGSAASNNTFGLSLDGGLGDMTYHLEFAYQTDAFDSPLDYATTYTHASLSSPLGGGFKGTVGVEHLGSDNGQGFRTPLATLHKFNGFADVFLNTPGTGLTDFYASVGTKLPGGVAATVFYHHFQDADLDFSYGDEIDLVLAKDLGNGLSVLGKGSWFFGDTLPDVTRISLEMNYKY